jgi:hypothetical protein
VFKLNKAAEVQKNAEDAGDTGRKMRMVVERREERSLKLQLVNKT